jgi:hypothetical protein
MIYAKIAAGVLFAALCFYLGGLAPKAALERDHADMAQAATRALLAQAAQAAADHASQQKVIDDYDANKDIPDPASIGTARRVLLLAAAGAGNCPVPETGAVAGGGARPAGGASEAREAQSGLVTLLEADLDDYIAACDRDDKRLILTQGLAPK